MALHCGHAGPAGPNPLCAHLDRHAAPWISTYRWYTGDGFAFELLCDACRVAREQGASVSAEQACSECFSFITDEVADVEGVRGQPGILVREGPPVESPRDSSFPTVLCDPLDVAAVSGTDASLWLVLARSGDLSLFDADTGTCSTKMSVSLPTEPTTQPFCGHVMAPRLHVSRDGRFAAVVDDYGRRGLVVDLDRAAVTMLLDGGDYHYWTVPFPLAFFEDDGRPRIVHRTVWNRLDVSDPATGWLLTPRDPTNATEGEPLPKHYLDYFHGRLYVSPGGMHVLDDGWVWHPVGVPAVWSLRRWLRDNPWESEDRPSRVRLTWRDYVWDHGKCWVSPRQVALGGIGESDLTLVDGVQLYQLDAEGRVPLDGRMPRFRSFAGPAGELFGDGVGDRVFSADSTGLSVWDPTDGARVQHVPGFSPTRRHIGARELVQVCGDVIRRLRY
jgi:hypothetical protein